MIFCKCLCDNKPNKLLNIDLMSILEYIYFIVHTWAYSNASQLSNIANYFEE